LIGFASLDGTTQYLNPAGLEFINLSHLDERRRPNVLDYVHPEDRVRVRDELWRVMMQEGRWVGEVRLQHFATGAAIPFFVDWFRIDDPRSVQPMNIAAICRDLTTQNRSEAELRHLNETLEQRVAARTRELADANLKLVAESIERRRMDARMQKLQLELYHAARFSEAGQMAAALAHELNQPLTAAANSASAGRRLLATGEPERLGEAREAMVEVAGRAPPLRGHSPRGHGQVGVSLIRRRRSWVNDYAANRGLNDGARRCIGSMRSSRASAGSLSAIASIRWRG
jgi:two-component system, LuxR family, sensor kinase FixL